MSVRFTAEWRGFRAPSGQFSRLASDRLGRDLEASARGLLTRIRAEAPISDPANVEPGRSPGALRRGLSYQVHREGNRARIEILSEAPYTGYVLRGRGEVRPKRPGGFLRFWYRGRWVFARRVRAVPPNDFVERGVRAYAPQLRREIGTLTSEMVRAFFTR